MDVTIEKSRFLPELALLQGVVDRKSTIPILSHVLLDAKDGSIALTGTDLDVTIRTKAEAEVRQPGACTVPAKKLFELYRTLPDGPTRLRLLDNNYVQIETGRNSTKLIALAATDYPSLPSPDKDGEIRLPLPLFRKAVEKVLFAVSSEEGRFQISGSLMKIGDGSVEMISTDGHRLALVEFEAPPLGKGKRPPAPTLIPKKALLELQRFEGGDDAEVHFGTSDNHIFFRVGPRQLLARALDVKFPDYEKVVSKDNDRAVVANVPELLAALRRVSLFSSDRSRAVRLDFDEGELKLSSANPDLGEAVETVPVAYDGEKFHIGLNAQYVADFLAEVDGSEVRLRFRDENTHCLGTPVATPDGIRRYVYVVMPMRL